MLFAANVLSLLVFVNSAQANSVWSKVNIERDLTGKIEALTIRSKGQRPSFKKIVHESIARAKNVGAYRQRLQDLNLGIAAEKQDKVKAAALQALQEIDFAEIEKQPKFRSVVNELGRGLDETFLQQNVLARLYDPTFFFRASWRKVLLEWAIGLIEGAGLENPVVKMLTYLFERALDNLIARRSFYQNYALHYLEWSNAKDLGLSSAERSVVLSSIYEARIEYYDFITSYEAQQDWNRFGGKSLLEDTRECNHRLENHTSLFDSLGMPYDFVFSPAQFKGRHVVANMRDSNMFGSDLPSLAYDDKNPEYLRQLRITFEIFLMALHLTPLPDPVGSLVSMFITSQFRSQIETEGALFAHYERMGDQRRMQIILEQAVNPWLF